MSHHVCNRKPEMCLVLYAPAGNLVTQIFAPQFDSIIVGAFKELPMSVYSYFMSHTG